MQTISSLCRYLCYILYAGVLYLSIQTQSLYSFMPSEGVLAITVYGYRWFCKHLVALFPAASLSKQSTILSSVHPLEKLQFLIVC